MAYETIHIHVGGEDPVGKKADMVASANSMGMSLSHFLMYCYDQMRPKLSELLKREAQKQADRLSNKKG